MAIGKQPRVILVVFILLLAFWLRVHLLGAQSFWNDEGNSARLSERSLRLIIEGTASDIHPPLYYLFLRGWRELAGETEFGLRAFSALAGVLTVALVAAVGRWVSDDREQYVVNGKLLLIVLIGALLTAVNPALIYYSQEARMYALLGVLAVGSAWCLLNWGAAQISRMNSLSEAGGLLKQADEGNNTLQRVFSPGPGILSRAWPWAAAYVLLAAAGLYTHYFFPAVLVAQNLLVLMWLIQLNMRQSPFTLRLTLRLLSQWILMMLVTLLLYAPWLPTFLQQFGVDDLSERGAFLPYLLEAVGWLAFGSTLAVQWLAWAVTAVILVLIFGIFNGRRLILTPAVLLLGPIGFMYVAGTVQPEFMKFLIVAVPFFCIWLATAVTKGKPWQRAIPAVLLLIAVPLGTMQSLNNLYNNPAFARADYRGMAARILRQNQPNAAVILNAPNQWEVFTYYYPDDAAVYPLPKGRSRPQPEAIDAALTDIVAQHERLYVLFWGDSARDPERLVERWLDEHAYKATEEWVGDVRFVSYAVPPAPASEMETAVALPFGEAITLAGFTLNETELRPGDILQATLFWKTAVSLAQRYKVFLHLISADGQLAAQRDSEPGGNLKPTSTWQPGETVIDNHGLLIPSDLPPGEYALYLGLYDVADPSARLPIQTSEGVVDSWFLTVVTVEPQE